MAREPTDRIRTILEEKYTQAQEGDFWALLELSENPTDAEVRRNYFRIAKYVHPDSLNKYSLQDKKSQADFVFQKLTQAFRELLDADKRREYQRKRKTGDKANAAETEAHSTQEQIDKAAKVEFHQAKLALNRRDWYLAEQHLARYTKMRPDNPIAYTMLGWAIFQNTTYPEEERVQRAHAMWQKALKLDEACTEAHYYMALYWKQKNNLKLMKKQLDAALELDPQYVPALREKRLLKMREERENRKKSSVSEYLRNLLGKLKNK